MDLYNLVPQILYEDKDYKVFLDIINEVSTDIYNLIKMVPEIVDIDTTPEIFLPKLSALVKYRLRQDLDIDYQREIVKRIIDVYRARGTDDEIIMAATYGDYDYWIGSHIFYPEAEINRQKAEIVYPVDELFRHSKSVFSGTDKFPGSTFYREGTIIIKLTYVNDEIRAAIANTIPAGIRIYYYLVSDTSTENGFVVDFGMWDIDYFMSLHIELLDPSMKPRPARRSHPYGERSSAFVFDGTRGTSVELYADSMIISPNDDYYAVALVGNKFVGDSREFEQSDLEITIIKDS